MNAYQLLSIDDLVRYCIFVSALVLIGWLSNNTLLFLIIALSLLLIDLLYQIYQHSNTTANEKILLNSPPVQHNRRIFLTNQALSEIVLLLQRGTWNQRKKTIRYSSDLRELYRMLNKLPYGLIVITKDEQIEWNNRYARKLLGLKKTDNFSLITMFVRAPSFVQFVESKNYKTPCIFSQTGANPTVIEVVRYDYGNTRDILLFRNITHEEQQQQMHKRFLADASHELQSPLTVIRGNAELALDTSTGKKQQTQLHEIIRQVENMSALMQSLMTLARVDESTAPENPEWINPQYTIRLASQIAQRELASNQEITFELLLDRELWMNKNDLFIIVRNLVSNAIKYGGNEQPIQVRWYVGKINQHNPNKKYAIIEVCDFGTGIHKDQINKIGKRFYQFAKQHNPTHSNRPANTANTASHGLGLSIIKGLLKLYCARLLIQSTPGKGSRFYCVFNTNKFTRHAPKKTVVTTP